MGYSDPHHRSLGVAACDLFRVLFADVRSPDDVIAFEGMSIVRPMMLQFPTDKKCAGVDVEDQYMFGSDWLVAPVYVQGAASRSVYLPVLPEGQVWENYYSNVQTTGGQRITEPTTLADFPLYRRAVPAAANLVVKA